MEYQICNKCKNNISISEFRHFKRKNRTYIEHRCRKCINSIKADRFRIKYQTDEQFRKDHIEYKRNLSNRLQLEYGISLNTFVRYGGKENVLSVYKRDDYRCRICCNVEKLNIHHIDGRGIYSQEKQGIKMNNHPSNLVILCSSCHSKLHFNNLFKRNYADVLSYRT